MYDLVLIVAGLSLSVIYLVKASRRKEQRRFHLIGATGFAFLALGAYTDGRASIAAFGISVAVLVVALLVREEADEKPTR